MRSSWPLMAVVAFAACVNGSDYTSSSTHSATSGHAASGGASGHGASAASGATGTSGASGPGATTASGAAGNTGGSTSGATTGSTTGMACPPPVTTLDDCDAGIELRAQVYELIGQHAVPLHAPVTLQNLYDQQTYVTDSCGGLVECDTPPVDLALLVGVTGYVSEIAEDLHLTRSEYYEDLDLFPTAYYSILTQSAPNFVAAQPAIYTLVRDLGARCPMDGWTFTVEDLDGGPVSAQIGYIEGVTVVAQGPTGTGGKAFLYNIVTQATQVRVIGTLDPEIEADAGFVPGTCLLDGGPEQYTGTIHLLPSTVSVFVYDLP